MHSIKPKTALISLSDKTGLEELVNFLVSENVKMLSTGGTYKSSFWFYRMHYLILYFFNLVLRVVLLIPKILEALDWLLLTNFITAFNKGSSTSFKTS